MQNRFEGFGKIGNGFRLPDTGVAENRLSSGTSPIYNRLLYTVISVSVIVYPPRRPSFAVFLRMQKHGIRMQ